MATLLAARPETPRNENAGSVADDVPEFYHYEDTGCEASDSCLDCPLPQCRYDDPDWYHRNRRLAKDFRLAYVMRQERLTVEEAAERFGITRRTVFRVLQRCREATIRGAADGNGVLAAA